MTIPLERVIEIMEFALTERDDNRKYLLNDPAPNTLALADGHQQVIIENAGISMNYWNNLSERLREKVRQKANPLIYQAMEVLAKKNGWKLFYSDLFSDNNANQIWSGRLRWSKRRY